MQSVVLEVSLQVPLIATCCNSLSCIFCWCWVDNSVTPEFPGTKLFNCCVCKRRACVLAPLPVLATTCGDDLPSVCFIKLTSWQTVPRTCLGREMGCPVTVDLGVKLLGCIATCPSCWTVNGVCCLELPGFREGDDWNATVICCPGDCWNPVKFKDWNGWEKNS